MKDFPVDPNLILGRIHDGLLFVDLSGKILWTNEVFKKMIGREDEDLTGRSCCELGVGAFCAENCIVKTQGKGQCEGVQAHFNVEVQAPPGTGKPGAYCFVASTVKNDEGEVIGYLENFRGMDRVKDMILQMDEVKEAVSNELDKANHLIDSMADGVFSVDETLTITRFSSNMERILGIPATEALGKPCRDVLRGTLCDTDCPLKWSVEHRKPVTGCREELVAANGRQIPVTISTGFLGDDETEMSRGLFGVLTDRSEVETLRSELQERQAFHGMIGRSAPMRALYQKIEVVAPTDATVLITGETGTGKELVARAIHRESSRAQGPFVAVNCAALIDDLLESELFGHVRGAFTGAVKERQGRFEQAGGGTLFLDEVGETSAALQVKLLRAVQERTIEPVGSGVSRKVDVRIIAATNRDLEQEMRENRFREDLYYRLNVIPMHVPPLRERDGDITLMIQYFIQKYAKSYRGGTGQAFEGISERALDLMLHYPWPGNARELEHAVEYAMISSNTGRIERAFLPQSLRKQIPTAGGLRIAGAGTAAAAGEVQLSHPAPDGSERETLLRALERHRWNVTATATDLGLSRTTLWRRMKQFEIRKS